MAAALTTPALAVDASTLWTREPKKVDPARQSFPRIEVPVTERDPGLEVTFPQPLRWTGSGPFETDGPRIRLARITLPERNLLCADESGQRWACGARGFIKINWLIAGKTMRCGALADAGREELATDCRYRGRSISERLVEDGWAVPVDSADGVLARLLSEARLARRGQWGSSSHR